MEWRGAEKLNYRSFYGQLNPSAESSPDQESGWVSVIPEGVHFRRWIVFNDGNTILYVKINSLENDVILIYPGEYFGDNITGHAVYIKNSSSTTVLPYRIVVSGVY